MPVTYIKPGKKPTWKLNKERKENGLLPINFCNPNIDVSKAEGIMTFDDAAPLPLPPPSPPFPPASQAPTYEQLAQRNQELTQTNTALQASFAAEYHKAKNLVWRMENLTDILRDRSTIPRPAPYSLSTNPLAGQTANPLTSWNGPQLAQQLPTPPSSALSYVSPEHLPAANSLAESLVNSAFDWNPPLTEPPWDDFPLYTNPNPMVDPSPLDTGNGNVGMQYQQPEFDIDNFDWSLGGL